MDRDKHSISPQDLYARLGSDAAPIVIDVRREADFADADRLVVPALHRTPDNVEQWQKDLHGGVVAYCFHGRELGQGIATALRLMGVERSQDDAVSSKTAVTRPEVDQGNLGKGSREPV